MIKTIIETAKLIFTSEESQKVDELTKNKHQESEKIMFRNLDEISSKFGISGVYTLNEITGADNNNSIQYEEFLELLYRALINTNQIDIDANFDSYSSSIEEKTYELVRFRLDRNSLFLVIRDKENERLYLSHEFRHISSINYIATEDRLKFWLDMIDVTYRFWLPFKKEELFAEHIQIDPIIYRN